MTSSVDRSADPLFSIVVIARNEAISLPRLCYLLEDFIERGGEVLVMDTGSTDDTVAIAKHRGCRVELVGDRYAAQITSEQAAAIPERFAQAGEGPLVRPGDRVFNFGDARQHAGSLASNDFVLQLDASDEVSALDIDVLNELIGSQRVCAFEYDQVYGPASLRIARFYDRNRYHWEGRVHEVLLPNAGADFSGVSKIRCDSKQLVVHHLMKKKERRYLAGLALQVLEYPEGPRWWHYLGRELFYEEWYESAIAVLEAHAQIENAWVTERSQSWCFRGECLKELRRYDEAEESYRRAMEIDHSRREPFLQLASMCSGRGRFADAVRWARESLGISRTSAYPELDANYSWRPHSLLYWNLFWLGRKAEAREHWQIFLSLAPEYNVPEHHARMFPQVTKTHEGSPSEVTGVVAQIRAADSDESSKPSKDPDPQT